MWKHWKGGRVLVICRAAGEPTGRDVVVYQHLGDGGIWVRTLFDWSMTVTTPAGDRVARFTREPDPEPEPKEVPVAIHGTC